MTVDQHKLVLCKSERSLPSFKLRRTGIAMRHNFLIMPICFGLAGCASSASEITPQYISPIQYQGLTCQQIGQEAERVSQRAAQLAGVQDEKSSNDAVAMGVGLVLFWPSLFFIKGDGQTAAELARLRGEFEALEQQSIQRNCGIKFQRTAAASPPPPPQDTGSIPKPLQ